MAGDRSVGVRVVGASELRRAIRRAQDEDLKKELKDANKAAAEMVKAEASSQTVPVKSGALKASLSALGSATKGQVKAGKKSKGTVNYAGVVHYGDPRRNRPPKPFLHEAMAEKWDEVYSTYEKHLEKIVNDLSTK